MSLLTVWVEDHAPGCSALAEVENRYWSTPWWYPGGIVRRAKDGRRHRHGSTPFFVFQCNTYQCSAEVLVRIEDVLIQVPNTR